MHPETVMFRISKKPDLFISQLEKDRALLMAGVSHDIRTLATRLSLRLEQLPTTSEREKAVFLYFDRFGVYPKRSK